MKTRLLKINDGEDGSTFTRVKSYRRLFEVKIGALLIRLGNWLVSDPEAVRNVIPARLVAVATGPRTTIALDLDPNLSKEETWKKEFELRSSEREKFHQESLVKPSPEKI